MHAIRARGLVRPHWRYLVLFLGAYVLCCGFSKWHATLPDTGISIWPPAGLLIATLILTPQRSWCWWALAAFSAELMANALWFRNPMWVAVLLSTGNVLCGIAGAWLVRRFNLGPVRLETLRDVLGLVALGALVAPVIAATVGAATLVWAEGQAFWKVWSLWWLGDATGVLLVAPLVLIGAQSWQDRARLSAPRLAEAALLLLALVGGASLSVGGRLPLAYIVMLPLLWAAIRFEFRGAVLALVLLTLISALFTGVGISPYAATETTSPGDRYVMQQLFLAVSAFSALVVAAVACQHRQALLELRAANDRLEERVALRTAELHRSEQRFRTLADSLPVMVWVTDAQGAVEFVNPECERFLGVREVDLQVGGWQHLLHPDDVSAYGAAFVAAQEARSEFKATARVRRADGAWRYVASHGVPRFSESGSFVGMVGSSPDVTSRIEQEQALAAEARRKDEFLAMLAHELRNPLAAIRNAVHLLARRASPDAVISSASGVIERQSLQLSRLVEDLLDLSRVSTGKVVLQKAVHNAADIVRAGIETARPLADEKQQKLSLRLPAADAIFVDGDAARLAQAVGNVVGNAVKFTPDGGHIEVTLRAAEGVEAALEIVVEDDGPGIDAALLSRVFVMFVQGETVHASASGGLGIGLAMVRQLVDLHGGSVSAHSEGAGQGARFVIRLPRAAAPAAATVVAPQTPAVKTRRVLIIDDNQDAADTLAMVLQYDGHDVTVCNNGPSGLTQAGSQAFDVVLLDLGLPGMDGYAVARALRADGASRHARLIAVTGYGQPEDRARTAGAGFDAHCVKPVDPATLHELLQFGEVGFDVLLAQRIDDARMLRMLDAWRALRTPARLPDTAALLGASTALEPWRAVVAVESLLPDFCLRFTAVGAQLATWLGPSMVGRRVTSDAHSQPGSLEAAYRAVALRGEPALDTAEIRFGPADTIKLKRLIVPASNANNAAVTDLVAIVLFEDSLAAALPTAFNANPEQPS